MVRSGSPICILAPSTFDPVVLNKRLAKVRGSEVLQPHPGNPADKEGRNQVLLRIATNLQQFEVSLLVRVPTPLGI